jgi:hypothetical protein
MLAEYFCTFATNGYINELKILIQSLSINNPNSKLIIFSDSIIKTELELFLKEHPLFLEIEILIKLDKYTNTNRQIMEKTGIFKEFTIIKADLIEYALTKYEYTVFLDSDILVVNPISLPEDYKSFDIGLCPHFILPKYVSKVGYFNSGFIFSSNKDFPTYWRNATKKSRYFEQASLENCAKKFKTFNFGENYNVAWWKIELGFRPKTLAYSLLTSDLTNIYYNKNPIIFIHSHFNQKSRFNEVIFNILKNSEDKSFLLKLIK